MPTQRQARSDHEKKAQPSYSASGGSTPPPPDLCPAKLFSIHRRAIQHRVVPRDSCCDLASVPHSPEFHGRQPKQPIEAFLETLKRPITGVCRNDLYGVIRVLQLSCSEDKASLSGILFHGDPGGLLKQSTCLAVGKGKPELTADVTQAVMYL